MGYNLAKKEMKKIFLILVALMGISMAANAQSCKISGTNDGSTIMVTQDRLEGDKVIVNLENDSESTCANVTVTVEVYYNNGKSQSFTGRVKSCPNQSATVTIPIQTKNVSSPMKNYKVTVSGSKCS